MPTVAVVVLTLAAADLVVGGVVLAVVAAEYRRVRRVAAADGRPLPAVGGQFLFVGGAVAAGVVAVAGALAWLFQIGGEG